MANFKIDENNNISRTSSSSKKGKATFSVSENGNIKRNKVEKKQKNGFFQSSKYFDNGYDFGDISKTFFWSGADLLQDVTRGFSRTIEGTIDTLGYLSADVLDFFGADNTADWLRDVSKYDVTGKLIKDSNYLEQRSVFGNYSDTVFEGVGNVGAMALTAGVTGGGVPSTVFSSFSSSYGNTMSEALRNGEDLSTARKAAFINGTAEAISEQFFSGLPGLKTENWGGKLLGKIGSGVERYFGTNTGKLAMKILNASGEGFEEIISNMLTSAGNDLMHKFDKNFTYGMEGQTGNILEDVKRAATSKESWNSFISAALTSALTNGGNQFISNTQKNNLIKSYAKENNITVNQVKNMFNQSVQQKTQAEMQRKPNMDLGQRVETENMAKVKTMQELRRGTFVQPGTETDAYQYAKSENQKVNEMNQSIVDAGGNNTQANREAAATAKRLIEDLGFNIKFTNNQQLQEQGQNVNGRNINGFVKDGTMYLNLDSDELANFTIGHETKHFFEANKEMNDLLNQSLKEYAQEKGIWDKRLAETTELYTDKDGNLIGDPEGELLADLTGEVFANYEFVNNLSIKNPSLFEKVRSFFQNLYYKATGQKEKLLIKQINDNLNKVYREYAKTQPGNKTTENGDTKYSLGVHYGDLGKARDTNYFAMSSGRRSTGHFGNGTYFVSQEESNRLNNDETFTRKARPQSEIEFDDYNLYKPKIESEGFRLHDGLKAVNYGEYDSTDFEMLKNDLMRNGISEEQINNAINEVERIRQELKDADYKKQVEADSLSTEFMKALGFNGIDVRGLEGLDNTGYGSVIYDLDNKINNEKTLTKDSQGRELSKGQQEFFKDSKIRDENGNLMVMYHGTPNKGFTEFWENSYFTPNEEYAKRYVNPGASSISYGKQQTNPGIYEVYLNMTNPFDLSDTKERNIYIDEFIKKGNSAYISPYTSQDELNNLKQVDWLEGQDFAEWLKENHPEYDGLIVDEGADGGYGQEVVPRGNGYIIFNSNQVKNIDNTNPTSNPDIRYSLSVKDANTTQDNEGRELSKEQKEYFADSKITDDKGNLITVYHTTGGENVPFAKAQFNVFNPVGTPGYRYGDQVVNFFTDSKDMSGSYVDQNYKMADTSKVTSLNEAEGIVDYYNGSGMIDYSIQENDGKYELYDNEADEVLHTFDSQEDLFKNIKQTVIEYSQLDENPDIDGYQYEGYLNITNPYIIDAQGNEWSKIPVDNILDLKQEIKNKWDTPENQLKELTGDTLKELNKDLTKLGYQLMNDKYGDLALYTKNGQLASDMLNVNDVMQEIRTDLDNDLQTPISTNDVVFSALAENAMGANYDGVIIKNVVDYGGANLEEQTPNNVYVSFKDNQFKAADNTNPTTDSDIRYSLSNKDSQGRELSEQQQEFYKDVSPEMLDKNGNLKVLYHGSNITDITTFIKDKFGDKGITFLTDDADIADTYRNKKGRRYEVYANIKNPYVIEGEGRNWNDILVGDNPNTENMYNSLTEDEKNYLTELANQMDKMYLGEKLGRENAIAGFYQRLAANNEQLYDKVTQDNSIYEKLFDTAKYNWNETYLKSLLGKRKNTNQLVKEIYDSGNYDGIVFKNIVDRGTNYHKPIGRRLSNVYVTFDSNQVKNVDNTNPTDNPDIRYSLSKNEDSYLDELSEQQMEYFKDTKAVDKQGYLDVVFHGTPKDFTVFDISQADNVALGNGLYFTTSEGNAKSYAKGTDGTEGKVLEGYVNIVNPASRTEKTLTFDNFKKLYNELNNNPEMYDEEMGMSNIDALLSDYGNVYEENIDNILRKFYDSYDNDVSLIDNLSYMDNAKEMYKTLRDVTGLDGIIAENPTGFDDKETYYIIFNPDQFKLKSNKTPTINEDMRYSISQEGEVQSDKYKDLFPGMTRSTTRLSDLKRKEVELPMEEENALKTAENEQKQGEKPTRREVIDKNRQLAREQLGDITQIKDKKRGLLYQINTMKRNLRDIMTKEQAQKMYDTYFKDITTNNAKIENDITSYNERIQKYNLNDKESTYTQMIGELKHNPETTLTKQQVDDFYYKNANKIDQQKCENAVNEFRQIYDELIEKVNDVLTDNGYKPIEYRKGYFPHFIEEKATSKLGKLAEKLGWKVKKGQLPTDIAGITDQFKPGKAWTSFSQQRTGDATDYNALKGLDNYLRGAMDVIHHTNDIQKLRALENEIRYQYSSKGVQDKINEIYADENLDMEEKNDAIANLTSNIRESGLGNFVTEIRNYTDNLANKKAFGDRSMEQAFGRDVYSIMNNINGRVSANMVGANISSAITNFIPITQAWSQLSTKNLMRGMYESIKTSIKGDNFADRSTFLTNRTKQAERLYNTKMDKLTQKLGVPFEAIDSFTSNTIVRAKYYDNIAKGMSEQEAMSNADEFAKDVMAGRSKGDQPTIFNRKNPLFKLFTAFQLEVNNQYGYMFKDIPTNMADEAKRKLVGAFIKMFLGAWLYNEITEKFTGRRAAFDPIDMAVSDVKTLTNEDMDLGDKIQSIVKDTAQEVPFVSGLAGGGRLPIQGAIPYSNPLEMVTKTFEDIGNLDDPKKRKTAINNLKKEWSKPVYYLAFPVAGGQIKKTVEGLSMYDKDLPIAGSYTNSGKLRFEADTSTLGKVQAAVFGQYASKNAREYFKNGYTPLTEGQVEEALEAELPINEYREINQGIKDAKAEAKAKGENQTEAMYDYIYDLPIEMEQKNSLINSRTKGSSTVKDKNGYIKYVDDKGKTYWYDKKNDIVYNSKYKEMDTKDIADLTKASTQKDISNYGDYGSLAEFNYSNKNPEKYLALTKIADYDTFMEYKDELAAIKQKYDNQPTEFKKKKVFEYINSLPLSVEQKLMLQKMGAGYSIKQYRGRLHNYINNMELTKEQKQAIDKVLFD